MQPLPPAAPSRRRFFSSAIPATALMGLPLASRAASPTEASPMRASLSASIATGLRAPRSICSGPGGMLGIAGDSEIQIRAADGTLLRTLRLEAPAIAVAIGRDGRLYAGLADHIEVFSAGGDREAVWARPDEQAALASLAVTTDGEVYASDGANRVVWRFDATGRVTGKLTHEGDPFSVPRDFFPVTLAGGRPVVAHVGRHRIETLGAEGRIEAAWGKRSRDLSGFGGCCNPIALAAMPDGGFVTAEGGLPRVKRFDRDGNFLAEIAGPDDLEDNARASSENAADPAACHRGGLEVAADENGRVLVLDRVSGEVKIFA